MTTLLMLLSISGFIGLRRSRFDLISFSLIVMMVIFVVASEHYHAVYGEIQVK
jgi:hypothetical protein